jgi:DNA-binding transcriptional MerR regulator
MTQETFIEDLEIDKLWFSENFKEFFKGVNLDGGNESFLKKRHFSLKETKISARTLNSWYKNSVLNDDRVKGKGWSKFSFSELLWIGIIKELRGFGFALKKIKVVKEYLESLNSTKYDSKFALIDFYLYAGVKFGKPIKLIVFSEGQTLLSRQEAIDEAIQKQTIGGNFISIDFTSLVSQLIATVPNTTDYSNESRTDFENEIKKAIDNEGVKSISIVKNEKDYLIEEEHTFKTRKEASQFTSTFSYGRTTEHKHNNKSVYKSIEQKKIQK